MAGVRLMQLEPHFGFLLSLTGGTPYKMETRLKMDERIKIYDSNSEKMKEKHH
jgi:hypothetical protein